MSFCFFVSSRRRHTRCALVTGVQTCALPIWHEASTPFHRPAWLYAVAQGTGQRAHYLVARDLAGTVAGALPLIEIRSRLFGRIMVSSGFAVGGGILAHSRKAVSELAAAGWALAIEKGCPCLEQIGRAHV